MAPQCQLHLDKFPGGKGLKITNVDQLILIESDGNIEN